jgi:transposase
MSVKKTYTKEQRSNILAYAESHTDKAASEMFGVSTNTISKWRNGGSTKDIELSKLRKFHETMLDKQLQDPATKDKIWDAILKDPVIRGKIGDLILDGVF